MVRGDRILGAVLECRTCRSIDGSARISPGPTIYEAKWWLVEHAYPSALLGWLVIVLKRHAEALHDLTQLEAEELGRLQWAVARSLEAETGCSKEYSILFAEAPGFSHVHFHLVPRAADLSPDLRGRKIFAFLKAPPEELVPADAVEDFCRRAGRRISSLLGGD